VVTHAVGEATATKGPLLDKQETHTQESSSGREKIKMSEMEKACAERNRWCKLSSLYGRWADAEELAERGPRPSRFKANQRKLSIPVSGNSIIIFRSALNHIQSVRIGFDPENISDFIISASASGMAAAGR
jgi:2-keto-4-pentenoate hydratase/2-oxohepta-3-ene-1,7-dioic acid hydratase in catechol pathway